MVSSQARSTEEYLRALSPEREAALRAIVEVVRANLPPGFQEGMQYGMIAWSVPLERLPQTYNGKPLAYIALASHKQYVSLYLNHLYGDPAAERWFRQAYETTGRRLNMGKSCVRFRNLEELPLDLIGQAVARTSVDEYIAAYRAARGGNAR